MSALRAGLMRLNGDKSCAEDSADREDRQRPVAQSFERPVIEIDVRQLDLLLVQTRRIDREAVIVRGDFNLFVSSFLTG